MQAVGSPGKPPREGGEGDEEIGPEDTPGAPFP